MTQMDMRWNMWKWALKKRSTNIHTKNKPKVQIPEVIIHDNESESSTESEIEKIEVEGVKVDHFIEIEDRGQILDVLPILKEPEFVYYKESEPS